MRLFFRILSALLLTLGLAVLVVSFLPGQKLAELAGRQIEKQTGREIYFGGDVRFSVWPVLGIQADNVALANADWAGPEPLLTAGRLSIGVAAADLLRGQVRVTELTAIVPHLNLETRADGLGNWVFDSEATQAAGGAGAESALTIEAVTLSGASLRYAAPGQAAVELSQLDLNLLWPDPDGAATVDVTLRPHGAPLQLRGEIDSFRRFLAGEVAAVGLTAEAGGGRARLDGRADLSGAFAGRVTGAAAETSAVLAALGAQPVAIPRGLGRGVEFAADATYTPDGRLSLRDLSLGLDHNAVQGEADLNLAATPLQLAATLRGGLLDLSALDAPAAGGTPAPGGRGWSSAPIDASALGMLDGEIALEVLGLRTSALELGASRITLSIEAARAVLELAPVAAFGGTLHGTLVANNRNGLSVAANMRFAEVQMQQALGQLAGYDKLTGAAEGSVEVLGVGNSVQQIMQSLRGKGAVAIGKGFFTGFDLQAIMNPEGGNGGTTVFDGLSARFDIAEGVLRNEDFLATLRGLKAEGAGRVGLGAQDLDYTFTPTALSGENSSGIAVPVRISGSWFDPEIRPDLSKLVQPKIDEAEEKAKQAVRDKLSGELGVPVEGEEDLNDALKRRVEEEARKQLLKFLGGN